MVFPSDTTVATTATTASTTSTSSAIISTSSAVDYNSIIVPLGTSSTGTAITYNAGNWHLPTVDYSVFAQPPRPSHDPSGETIYSGLANCGPFIREVVIDNDSFIKLIRYMGAPYEQEQRTSVTVITRYGSLVVRNQKYVLSLDDLFEDVPHKFAK
jgi:hypothetical protein